VALLGKYLTESVYQLKLPFLSAMRTQVGDDHGFF